MGIEALEGAADPRREREDGRLQSFADVEGRMVEAMRMLWRDEPGRWPFASDGPWHLFVHDRSEHGYLDAVEAAAERIARQHERRRLTRDEMAEMEEAAGWLALVEERDRRLVVLAVRELAKGARQVPWRRLLGPMGLTRGADGLRKRYGRAMNKLTVALNAAEKRR